MEFTRDNWPRFLDGGATFVYPDGSKKHVLVRTGFSQGICGDTKQTDINGKSGLETAARIMDGAEGVSVIRFGFEDIVRSGITAEVIKRFTDAGY